MTTKDEKINETLTEKAYDNAKEKAEEILKDEEKTENLIEKAVKKLKQNGALDGLSSIPYLIEMTKCYIKGEYKEVPIGTIGAVVAAIVYWVSPLDIIPDVIPGVGYLDDAAVVMYCLKAVGTDLDDFKKWYIKNKGELNVD